MANEIFQRTTTAGKRADSDMMVTCLLLVIELAIYPLFVYLSVRLVTRIKTIGHSLASKSKTLYKEQRRNTEMVSQMYPKSIASKLLGGEHIEPEIFEQATVCFSVLTDFEDIISVLSADEAITVLNRVLEIMEDEILKYDVFKVETREDMVLLASGVPRRTPHNCEEIADLCLSLRTRMRSVCLGIRSSTGVRIKSGFCTGRN
ncbi:receptor-type guanylate cyclase gcy-12 [Elysia marginata]|uniref:Receptor-type guanylate cyclase gcy-12 n=1 Tax=Elysia marginata TaxID=1093978 RepID=A0AAV4HJS8_9GAST|nr:receptor-type guanylate cyclase gcy-12 [Elysia marginata]